MKDEQWLVLRSGPGQYAFNMALDEALLEAMPALGRPLLRFYAWTESAASFGYFQKFAQISQLTQLRPLVRRPTAGGLVPHDADWTYSLAFPPGHWWYALRAPESYRRVHEWLQQAFGLLGLQTELAAAARKTQPGQCFVGHEQFDLLWHGRKIAGAAQRRRRDGLLIQGSVQPPPGSPSRGEFEQAMLEAVSAHQTVGWADFEPRSALLERARELAQRKYAQRSYNEGR